MSVKNNHKKCEAESPRWRPGPCVASGGTLVEKCVENGQILPFFWVVWVPRMSMEWSTFFGTNIVDEETLFITSLVAQMTPFWAKEKHQASFEEHPCCIPFQVPALRVVFHSHTLRWAPFW